VTQVAQALDYAQRMEMVHRDISVQYPDHDPEWPMHGQAGGPGLARGGIDEEAADRDGSTVGTVLHGSRAGPR